MTSETKIHTLEDSRELAYCEYGDPNGDPVFHAHGVPSSRLEGMLLDSAARTYGFRLISTDRPGIGKSTYLPNRVFLDYPKDIVSLADSIGIERFGVMGGSGGGAHTAVCAYAIPERLNFNVTICPFVNFAEFPSPEAKLSNAEAFTWKLTQISPGLVFMMCSLMGITVRTLGNRYEKWAATAANQIPDMDGEVARSNPEKMKLMGPATVEAFVQGGKGVAADTMIQYSDWGFRLADTKGKILLFHGTGDSLVPYEFGQYIAEQMPNCELHSLEGYGHLILIGKPELIFETARKELDQPT